MPQDLGGWTLFVPVLAAGALLPIQALVNARFGGFLGSALWATAFSNVVGALTVGLVIAIVVEPVPSLGRSAGAPIWSWLGGAMGMLYVLVTLFAAPRLGTTATMAGVIAGQLLCALALDHFGVLHERRAIDMQTLAGVALLVVGIALIVRRG